MFLFLFDLIPFLDRNDKHKNWNMGQPISYPWGHDKMAGHHFSNDIPKCIFLNGNVYIFLEKWLKFLLRDRIDKLSALV